MIDLTDQKTIDQLKPNARISYANIRRQVHLTTAFAEPLWHTIIKELIRTIYFNAES